MKKVMIILSFASFLIASDKSDIESLINNHWESWNLKKYKDYISSVHSGGTRNGDSNGSFWYENVPTIKNLTASRKPGDKSSFNARYIEVDVLVPGKAAVAYYYLVGSYTLGGVTKNDYRTRVSQVFLTEKGQWKIKSGHFSPLHSGSGIPN
ncbi:MAG: hypothetical protein P8O00_09955 [Candidatus Marinimicrobia bacterium]|nr:hypothetical protein [Candidatus Neomarinimicrobiota bacterium]